MTTPTGDQSPTPPKPQHSTSSGSGYYKSQPRQPKPPPKKASDAEVVAGVLGACVVIGLIIAWIAGAFSGGDDEVDTGAVDRFDAQAMCKQFVEDALKSPTTAEFSDENSFGSGAEWTSTGTVAAQNSFGAMISSDYRCEMTYDAETEMWSLTSLTGLD